MQGMKNETKRRNYGCKVLGSKALLGDIPIHPQCLQNLEDNASTLANTLQGPREAQW